MSGSPPSARARVFARLPESLHRTSKRTEFSEQHPGGLAHSVLEGPAFDREGNLWCVDVPFGRIFRIPAHKREFQLVCEYDGEPNGLAIHQDGRIFVADYKHGIMLLEPGAGRVSPAVTRYNLERFKGVNDLVFSSQGELYFTDQGATGMHDPTGRVFRLCPDGRLECLLRNVPSPNGIALDPAERHLYVAVTRDNAIWRVPLLPKGRMAKVGRYIQLSGGVGPDGLAVDQSGRIAIAHPGLGVVWVYSDRGELILRIESEAGSLTTNAAFGGPDGRTLFITEGETGSILTSQLDVPGKVLFSHHDINA
jgi:gluconolactonase